jgi:hypothetical protein
LQNSAQVLLTQDNNMIDAFTPDRSDQSLGDAVLKGNRLHSFRSMGHEHSKLRMYSTPFTGMSSR